MAEINNDKSNTLLTGTSGDDSIQNGGYWSDSWHDGGSNVTINAGAGNDDVLNYDGSSNVTINTGAGNDEVRNWGSSVTINTGAGNDVVDNNSSGDSVIINTGAGNDEVWNYYGESVTINTGDGNDFVFNLGDSVTISGGKGNDSIYNNCYCKDDGSIHYYTFDGGNNVLFKYEEGDGNDIIYRFKADSTLSIGGGSYSTTKSGKNIIVTVGDGKFL